MTGYFVSPQEALRRVLGGLNNGDRMLWSPEIDVIRAALSHAEGEAQPYAWVPEGEDNDSSVIMFCAEDRDDYEREGITMVPLFKGRPAPEPKHLTMAVLPSKLISDGYTWEQIAGGQVSADDAEDILQAIAEQTLSAPQVAVPEDAILARGWYHHVSGDDYDIYDAKDENCDRCTEVAIVRADAITPTHKQEESE